jgi:hypothetical protein
MSTLGVKRVIKDKKMPANFCKILKSFDKALPLRTFRWALRNQSYENVVIKSDFYQGYVRDKVQILIADASPSGLSHPNSFGAQLQGALEQEKTTLCFPSEFRTGYACCSCGKFGMTTLVWHFGNNDFLGGIYSFCSVCAEKLIHVLNIYNGLRAIAANVKPFDIINHYIVKDKAAVDKMPELTVAVKQRDIIKNLIINALFAANKH